MSTPSGWYTDPEDPTRQRYWDGQSWTEHRTDPAPAAAQPAPAQPAAAYATTATLPPKQNNNTLRNVLIVAGVVLLLMLAGCVALVVAGGNAVDNAIDEFEESQNVPGGPENPLEIEEGQAFEVDGFDYAAGWSVSKDPLGNLTVKGLKVTNNREDQDGALVEIRFLEGTELVALADCTTPQISPGQTVTLDCFSADPLPKSYDTITINDTF